MKKAYFNGIAGKLVSALTAFILMAQSFSVPVYARNITDGHQKAPIEGKYVPGDVIICIQPGRADENRIAGQSAGILSAAPDISSEELLDVSLAASAIEKENSSGKAGLSSFFGEKTEKTVLKCLHSDSLSTEELIDMYSGKSGVLFAEPNYIWQIEPGIMGNTGSGADPGDIITGDLTGSQYAYGNGAGGMDVPDWNKPDNINSEGVVVAVLDSGVDYNHPDLKDVMWDEGLKYKELTDLGGGRYGIYAAADHSKTSIKESNNPMDENGHGTHCAGIIAASWNGSGISGIANGARIMAVRHTFNEESNNSTQDSLKGFNYIITAKKAGVNVRSVNCSFGGPGYENAYAYCSRECGENGIVVCYAAGNEHINKDLHPDTGSSIIDIPSCISVGSSNSAGRKSPFSNYGSRTTHLLAPGSAITSSVPLSKKRRIPDPERIMTPPAKDVSGNELYDDFSSESQIFTYTPYRNGGTKIDRSDGMLKLNNSGFIHPDVKNFLGVVTISANNALPVDGKKNYSLVIGGNVKDEGDWEILAVARTKDGGIAYSNSDIQIEDYTGYHVIDLVEGETGKEIDFEHLSIELLLFSHNDLPEGTVLKEMEIEELWITDAPPCPFATWEGTSMATPAVAGEAAVVAAEFPDDSADKTAARILAGVKKDDSLTQYCITGGIANLRNSLNKASYTPVVNRMYTDDDSLRIDGYFFETKENTDVSIAQGGKIWSATEGTLKVRDILADEKDPDHKIICLDVPEDMTRDEEATVTVKDASKAEDRNSYSRRLIIKDPGGILKEGDCYRGILLSDEDLSLIKGGGFCNSFSYNGSVYYVLYYPEDAVDAVADDPAAEMGIRGVNRYETFRLTEGGMEKAEFPVSTYWRTAVWNGMVVYVNHPDTEGRKDDLSLIFSNEQGLITEVAFSPEAKDDLNGESVLKPLDLFDKRVDLYYDGKDLLLFRSRVTDEESYTAVYVLSDPLSGKAEYLGKLNHCYGSDFLMIAHEEKSGDPNSIYIIGGESKTNNDGEIKAFFYAERFSVEGFKDSGYVPESLDNIAPGDYEMGPGNAYPAGCGVRNGIFLAASIGDYTAPGGAPDDNFFYDYEQPEKGFRPEKRKISHFPKNDITVTAGYGKVYFAALQENGLMICSTEADTLPHYGDSVPAEKPEDYSTPGSSLHASTGEDIEKLSASNIKYEFDPLVCPAVVANTKSDVSTAFAGREGYEPSAKHRYKIEVVNGDKKCAKINKKGVLTPKKRGEILIRCEQKMSGAWTALGDPLRLFIQLPEMEKKAHPSASDATLDAYAYLRKATYSPTAWKVSNKKVASVDPDTGVITILKPGKTDIIAEYGSGKMGSKKKYRTKLVVR